jgi:predicted thioesterase
MKVKATATVTDIDDREIVFEVKAFDEVGEIGCGTHTRFIIDNERFMAKAKAKLQS